MIYICEEVECSPHNLFGHIKEIYMIYEWGRWYHSITNVVHKIIEYCEMYLGRWTVVKNT